MNVRKLIKLKEQGKRITAITAYDYSFAKLVESANIDMVPKNLHNVESDKEQSVITLLEALEDHDDIKAVYTNFDSVE